jgi:3-methyl-2-oxobutanoate hydroxymethyltransferase
LAAVSWVDGRMRMAAIGYAATALDSQTEAYADVARTTLDAITAYAEDVRAGRQIKGSNQSKEQFRRLRTPRSDGSA